MEEQPPALPLRLRISSVFASRQVAGSVYYSSLACATGRVQRAGDAHLRNMFIPESIQSLTLLSSVNALSAIIGAE